ncbi:hypothetical protein [Streptomyces qinglanensis]|uniref:hypothetical protein n=1 Tax=Streptomyces qinglanensis TaxID=943816 RepID=UPI0037A6825E
MRRTPCPQSLDSDIALSRAPHLADQLQQTTSENTALHARITELEDDLAAARTSLRRMIRDENLHQ